MDDWYVSAIGWGDYTATFNLTDRSFTRFICRDFGLGVDALAERVYSFDNARFFGLERMHSYDEITAEVEAMVKLFHLAHLKIGSRLGGNVSPRDVHSWAKQFRKATKEVLSGAKPYHQSELDQIGLRLKDVYSDYENAVQHFQYPADNDNSRAINSKKS